MSKALSLGLLLAVISRTTFAGTIVELPSFQFRYGEGVVIGGIAIACAPDNMMYVAEENTNTVVAFTSDGAPMGRWPIGAPPTGVAAGADGSVWVTSGDSADVRKFSRSGALLVRFGGQRDDLPGHLWYPRSIAVGPGGDMFVADDARDVIARFTPLGEYVRELHTSPCTYCNTS